MTYPQLRHNSQFISDSVVLDIVRSEKPCIIFCVTGRFYQLLDLPTVSYKRVALECLLSYRALVESTTGPLVIHIRRAFDVPRKELIESVLWLLYSIDRSTAVILDADLYDMFLADSDGNPLSFNQEFLEYESAFSVH